MDAITFVADQLQREPSPEPLPDNDSKTGRMRRELKENGPATAKQLAEIASLASSGLVSALLKYDVEADRRGGVMADDRANPIDRVVPADGAPPVGRGGSPFDVLSQFGRQPEPSEPSEPNEPPKRRGAPNGKRKKAAAPTPTRAHGTQFQVACVLLTAGEEGLHRDAVADRLEGVAMKVLANALTNMKSAGRVERVGGTQWRLTDTGQQWATGGGRR